MGIDIGSWDVDCISLVREIRAGILALVGDRADLTVTPFQGSGSYGVEAAVGSAVPRDGKLLILKNGAYGLRMTRIAAALGIAYTTLEDSEDCPHDPARLGRALADDPALTHVACVHCETTTGVLNPIRALGLVVAEHGRRYIVDAISTFGSYGIGPGRDTDFDAGPIDHLLGSANKCIEGVPGFAFVISRRTAVEEASGQARSLSLDLYDQWSYMERTGQFRFTPPTHVLLAFRQALRELEEEGGVDARAQRYRANHRTLVDGMQRLGFEVYVPPEHQSHIITAFRYPEPGFSFGDFYARLHARGYIIYPGKLSDVDTFRIANIGHLDQGDIEGLLRAIAAVREAAARQ
jgi:2-aminoethylphosphonate-pyruvate transaminase